MESQISDSNNQEINVGYEKINESINFDEFLNANHEVKTMFDTLDNYIAKQKNGGLYFDGNRAYTDQIDPEIIEVGIVINSISDSIDESGFSE